MRHGYKRAVHCSYCGGEGHNRRTCSDLKERAEEGSAWAKEQVERYKRVKKRCSFCTNTGHTRPTCPEKKNYLANMHKITKNFRKGLKGAMQKAGLGIGSLIESHYGTGIVTSINWNFISPFSHRDERVVDFISFKGRRGTAPMGSVPGYYGNRPHQSRYYQCDILSPCKSSGVNPPTSWARGEIQDTFLQAKFRDKDFCRNQAYWAQKTGEERMQEIASPGNPET